MSNANDDFPDPDKPVMTTSLSRGISRLKFFRLCWRAPPITIFDLDSLDISSFLNKKFILKKVAKEKRSEIFIELSDGVFIEICAGRNAFNRGIWIKGVRTPDYIDIVSKTNYIKILLKKSVKLSNFNKNTFMFERAKRTLELIKEYY